jgi:arginine:ornithine antiporter/lysine permease
MIGGRLNLPSDMSKAASPGGLVGWRVTGIGMLMAFVYQGLATRKPDLMPVQGHLDRM